MKRIAICLIITFLSTTLMACHPATTLSNSTTAAPPTAAPSPDYLSMIYEMDAPGGSGLNHSNVISSTPEPSVSDSATREIVMELCKASSLLVYHSTLYYPIGGETVHQYLVNSEENASVLLNSDGSVHSLLCTFATLDISKTDSSDEVLPLLKAELEEWVDITKYEHLDVTKLNGEDAVEFGIYDFLFYNQIAGYMTDYALVSVDENGAVFACKIRNLPVDDISLNIDKNLEKELIELKMKDIYSSETTEYKAYKDCYPPNVRMYNNELCIEYHISATLARKETHQESGSFIHSILIPVRLMTAQQGVQDQ